MDVKGKTAIVTGSSQGLGRVFAKTLAKAGARVIVNCAHHPDKAQAVVDEIHADGGIAEVYVCDVSDEKAIAKMFQDLGRVDILVNNARVDPYSRRPEMTEGEWWDRVMDISLKSCFLCSMAFFDQAKDDGKGGVIVNISSVRAFRPAEMHMIAYGVSKLGMHGITRAIAHNGAKFGIRANTICPGMCLTENLTKRLTPEQQKAEGSLIPIGRGSTMEENADAVMFAIENDYVTGETININGGMYYAP